MDTNDGKKEICDISNNTVNSKNKSSVKQVVNSVNKVVPNSSVKQTNAVNNAKVVPNSRPSVKQTNVVSSNVKVVPNNIVKQVNNVVNSSPKVVQEYRLHVVKQPPKKTAAVKEPVKAEDLKAELRRVEALLSVTEERIESLNKKRAQLAQQRDNISNKIATESAQKLAAMDWRRMDHPWSDDLLETLTNVFKISKLRDLQLSTINAIMSKQDVILIMPTGGGKSLCYQLPALLLPGVTLVISPLISLMEDQVMGLHKLGVHCDHLCQSRNKTDVIDIEKQMLDPHSPLKLLYVSPEKLSKSKRFMARLEKMYQMKRLSLVAIDEVHCCSQWGHDFRPDYKYLNILRRQFPLIPILGVTATAPSKVVTDLQQLLRLDGSMVLRSPLNRPNLKYEVTSKSSNYQEVVKSLAKIIKSRFDKNDSGIIYCFSIKECEELARDLTALKIKSKGYHAQLDPEYRKDVHMQWVEGDIQVVVATIAFGMGIDKPDVRFVIHHSLSKSMENFYQESGRAGRDGKPALCLLMYRFGDIFRQSTMVFTERTGLDKLYSMANYCNNHTRCRRELIAEHFEEAFTSTDCKGMCDNCAPDNNVVCEETDVTNVCKLLYETISNASALDERVTAQKLLDALQGKGPTKYRPAKYGSLSLPVELCQTIISLLLLDGYLKEEFHFTSYTTISYLNLGPKSEFVLSDSGSILYHIPSAKRKAPTNPKHKSNKFTKLDPKGVGGHQNRDHQLVTVSSSEDESALDDPERSMNISDDFGKLK